MNRWIVTCVATALTTAALAGCNSNGYQPNADSAQLASVAAKMKYPAELTASPSPSLTFSVADNGVITLSNAGDESLSNFTLWVNKSYSLLVDQLPAHTQKTFAPELFYNADGQSLKAEPVSQNWTVQVQNNGQLMDAKIVKM